MLKEFDKWVECLEKYVEEELGPMPPFKYEYCKDLYYNCKEYPFMAGYDETPLLLIGRKGMNDWFFNRLRGKEIRTKERGLGGLIFSLSHDIIHIYQLRTGNFDSYYDNCIEGLAQLYAIRVCNKMYEEAKHEDFSLLKKGDSKSIQNCITIFFESKKYKNSISEYLSRKICQDTLKLRKSNIIKKEEYFNYPFELNQEIISKIKEKIHIPLKGKQKFTKEEIRKDPYLWGSFQLSKVISKGKYTMKELIDMPLSNRSLKNLAQH